MGMNVRNNYVYRPNLPQHDLQCKMPSAAAAAAASAVISSSSFSELYRSQQWKPQYNIATGQGVRVAYIDPSERDKRDNAT